VNDVHGVTEVSDVPHVPDLTDVDVRIGGTNVSPEEVATIVVALILAEDTAYTEGMAGASGPGAPHAWQRAAMTEHVGGARLSSPRDLARRR
jgi:hypothetical protein